MGLLYLRKETNNKKMLPKKKNHFLYSANKHRYNKSMEYNFFFLNKTSFNTYRHCDNIYTKKNLLQLNISNDL